jgi:uncharacterized protein YbjQ (UPF0145 family)
MASLMTADQAASLRYCVFISCPLRGEPTLAERCPSCERFTQEQAPARMQDVASEADVTSFPRNRITTLIEIPGCRIVEIKGIVSNLSASSGLTATMKGNQALGDALSRLAADAVALGANAIVGLTGSPFGAAGGITKAFGGDAVGILLLGTAVVVAVETQD